MKKFLKALLFATLVLSVLLLCMGCSSSSGDTTSDDKESDSPKKAKLSIEEQVILEQDFIVITAKKIEKNSYSGHSINLLIENNSEMEVVVSSERFSVNGYNINNYFSEIVTAGNKVNTSIDISTDILELMGISNIGEVDISFVVYETENYDEIIRADAQTIKTSLYDSMDDTIDEMDIEIFNDRGLRIVGKYVEDSDVFYGEAILLFIENNSDTDMCLSCNKLSVNEYMIDIMLYSEIDSQEKKLDYLLISEYDLEENEIESVDSIEASFKIIDANNYSTLADDITIVLEDI